MSLYGWLGEEVMKKKVMVVDDEADILTSLRTVFERQNFEVITVESGFKCLEELEKGFKGVVLMDIMMPEMDGWDTIKEIVKRGFMKNIAIEIITGIGTRDHNKMNGFESFIQDYHTKPLDIEQLISSVEKCDIAK